MALTKVGPAGIGSTPGTGYVIGDSFLHSTGLNATNAYYTGIVTAQTFRVLGNFQVDGTTTTLDTEVTSVDKLEVAANNTTVGVAITQSGSGDIFNLYDGSTEVFSVANGGNAKFLSNARQVIIRNDGTAGFPKIDFRNSADSGDAFAAINGATIDLQTGGSTKLHIANNGKVGIGTDNPNRLLQVYGESGGNGQVLISTAGAFSGTDTADLSFRVYANPSNGNAHNPQAQIQAVGTGSYDAALLFKTAVGGSDNNTPTERLRITSAGKIGIGGTITVGTLTVAGDGKDITFGRTQNSGTGGVGRLVATGNTVYIQSGANASSGSAADLVFSAYGGVGEKLRITSAGNVGIGLTNPTSKLQVANGHINLSAGYSIQWSDSHERIEQSDGKLEFFTANGEKMVLSGNNLGIGANNNTDYDSNAQNLLLASDGNTGMTIRSAGSTPFAMIHFADGTSGQAQQRAGRIMYQHDGDNLSFHTANTERVRITGTGKVGVGVLPAAWHSSASSNVIQVGSSVLFDYSSAQFDVGHNYYYDGSNYKYTTTGYAHRMTFHKSDGTIRFWTLGTGSANNNVTLSERLRITSAGNLLVNTTSSRIVEDHVGNGPQGKIQIEATNSDAIMSIISAGTADANRCGTINLGRHRNSTVGATPTIVNDNDALGAIVFSGGDGTDMRCVGAKIHAEVDGTPGSNDMPGALVFSTTPDGVSGSYQQERLRISSTGAVKIGGKNQGTEMSEFGSNVSGLTIDDVGVSHTGLRLSHGNDDTYLVQANNNNFYMSSYLSGDIIFGVGSTGQEKFRLTQAGQAKITGTLRATHGSSGLLFEEINNGAALWLDGANGDFSGGDYYGIIANNSAELQFGYAGASHLVLDSAGKMKLKATGGSGTIAADFQEGTSATDSKVYVSLTTGYSSGSNEGSSRIGTQRAGNGNAGHFIVATRAGSSNISSGWYDRFKIKDNSQIQYNSYRAHKYAREDGGGPGLYNFRLAIDMVGSTAYTIRLGNFSNGAHHVRLLGSHWTGGYNLVKESYFYTDTYQGLSETTVHNITSSTQGAWSVSRPSSGQTGHTWQLIITKSAGSYHGGHVGMIDIISPNDLYLVSIT